MQTLEIEKENNAYAIAVAEWKRLFVDHPSRPAIARVADVWQKKYQE
jgi:hypothetical protein